MAFTHAVKLAKWKVQGPKVCFLAEGDDRRGAAADLGDSAVIINLAGAPIAAGRWTAQAKARLRNSREGTTSALVAALSKLRARPVLLISASAIGYYGPRQDEALTEESPSGSGFLASLCREWEAAARAAERLGV